MKKYMTVLALPLALSIVAGCTGSSTTTPPDTPDGAANALIESVKSNQPDQMFALMPPTYQNDVNALVKDFATRMDADLWNGVRARLGRLGKVLKTKEAIIIEAASANPAMADQDLKTMLPQISAFLQATATSSLTDLEQLKKGDLKSLLAKDGNTLMSELAKAAEAAKSEGNPLKMLESASVELISSDETTATVKITSGEEAEELELTKVDGAWVPAEMAAEWTDAVAEAKKSLQQIDFTTEEGLQMKAQANMFLAMADGIITQIEAAKTAEEMTIVMNTIMGQVMGAVMGGAMGGGGM